MSDLPAESYYSDDALAKQAELAAIPDGQHVPLTLLWGLYEPRIKPTPDERCACCELDARDSEGGEEHRGLRWCFICVGRGHHENDDQHTRQQATRKDHRP